MTLASQNTGGKERRTPADRSVGIRRLYGTAGPCHGLRQPTLADPRAGDEMLSVGGREGEAFGLALAHIEDELRMLPDLVLAAVDIERAATHLAQEHILAADDELPVAKAHREAAVAAASRP